MLISKVQMIYGTAFGQYINLKSHEGYIVFKVTRFGTQYEKGKQAKDRQ